MKNIYFFYPSKILGGAEMLFYRLSKMFADNSYNVFYIDCKEGFISNEILNEKNININILNISILRRIKINDKSILIAPLSSVFDLNLYLEGNFNILLWSIHPYGLKSTIDYYNKYNMISSFKIYGDLLDEFINKNGLYFMDKTNYVIHKNEFSLKNMPIYLPILCEESKQIKKNDNSKDIKKLEMAWIGRLSIDKIYSLNNVIKNCIKYCIKNSDININLHIIGDGDSRDDLLNEDFPSNFRIIKLGTIQNKELSKYLISKIEIVFAMGTSALESSFLKIPTFCLDFTYSDFFDDRFNYIFNLEEYEVGRYYSVDNKFSNTFDEIIESSLDINNLIYNGQKCYDHVYFNHSPIFVFKKIEDFIPKVNLTFYDINISSFLIPRIFKVIQLIYRFFLK